MDAIKAAFPALAAVGAAALLVAGMVAAIRWAKRAGAKAAGLGGALMLMFSMGVVPPREQQTLEEAKESKDKKGGESGDPPARDIAPRATDGGRPSVRSEPTVTGLTVSSTTSDDLRLDRGPIPLSGLDGAPEQ